MTIAKSVLETLRTWSRQQAGELLRRLDVSRPSLMRAIAELDGQVVSRGRARRTAYAARRSIRGNPTPLVLYRIDESGRAHEAGLLEPIYPEGCAMSFAEACPWPLDDEMADGWFRGVPYPLGDMRPQGFLGRNFAHQFAAILQVDEDVTRWGEDDVLHALSVLGWDQPGDYILGEHALRRFLDEQQRVSYFLTDDAVDTEYPSRALQALNFGAADSSAAGEFPKFTARRLLNEQPTHVIVKFSGADGSPQEQRWSDLLVCEHLALTTIADTLQLSAAQSRIYQLAGRTFYEVDRFDRHGEFGRSGVCTWHELNAALLGLAGPWSDGAQALLKEGYISAETARQITLLEHFGRLIANTDMHDGNLAFLPGLTLTPAYDMLPMQYAPQRGVELVERKFTPALPVPREHGAWVQAAEAAVVFWHRAARDERISERFRSTCKANADHIEHLLVVQRG
ncbi:type II toxin-antitoxin system HipA family toxin YjjJ [Collimonas sp. OK307]|uniref:type II toxin-antitoxin system HipA family toxin YjjJ n=1 Tax=Collimonas sp. OK307 TaxID=1801620 RepID=UPI000B810E0B|nr:type II toxin-antitoxin system HipA family toxin YjjJ [Collimonas sp. OK307]